MIVLLLGCTATDVQNTPETSVLSAGWVGEVAADAEAFQAVVNQDRPGWTALHRNDWATAWQGSPPVRARAGEELVRFHRVLGVLYTEAWEGTIEAWSQRGGLPTESAIGVFAELAGVKALAGLSAMRPPPAFGTPTGDLRAWMLARTDTDLWALEKRVTTGDAAAIDALRARAADPAWREPLAGGERRLYDPLIHQTLAGAFRVDGPALDGLDARLFSDQLAARGTPTATGLAGLGITAPATDDPDGCRAVVAALDAELDPWEAAATKDTAPGGALVDELRLVDGLRSRVLTSLAVHAVDNARNACAAIYAQDSLDAASGRTVGPINHPTAYAVLALADLRMGRVREALDALQPLMEPFPETNGVREVTGDLSVLLGMDRIGDSREN